MPCNHNESPSSVVSPLIKNVVNGCPLGKIVGQISPLATGTDDVQDGVENLFSVDVALGMAFRLGNDLFDVTPLTFGNVGAIFLSGHGSITMFE